MYLDFRIYAVKVNYKKLLCPLHAVLIHKPFEANAFGDGISASILELA